MRLAALLLALTLPLAAQNLTGLTAIKVESNETDKLFNAAAEESDPIRMDSRMSGSGVMKTFKVSAIASGNPTTCTWNIFCADYLPEQGIPTEAWVALTTDKSCVITNAERQHQIANRTCAVTKVRLVLISGGSTPAVEFKMTGVQQ